MNACERLADCHLQADIVIILDASSSSTRGEDNWQLMLDFVTEVIQALNVGEQAVHVGLMRYHKLGMIDLYLEDFYDKESILLEVNSLHQADLPSDTSVALRLAREELFNPKYGNREGVPDVILLVTSQNSDLNTMRAWDEASIAEASGIHITTVGITEAVTEDFLASIASDPVGVFRVNSYTQLNDIALNVVRDLSHSLTKVCLEPTSEGTYREVPL